MAEGAIVFCSIPLPGAMGHAIPLARAAAARGHRILFVGAPGCRPFLAPHGLAFEPLSTEPEEMPPEDAARVRRSAASLLGFGRRETARLSPLLEDWLGPRRGPLEDLRERHRPALFVIDGTTLEAPIWMLAARRLGVPAVLLTTPIGQAASAVVPPAWTVLPPAGGPASKLRLLWEWHRVLAWKRLLLRLRDVAGCGPDLGRLLGRLAAHCRTDPRELRFDSYLFPRLDLPEIVVIPEELDFPQARRPDRTYFWLPAPASGAAAAGSDPRPLVYCFLGSVPRTGPEERLRFFRAVFATAAVRPDLRFRISLARLFPASRLGEPPGNVEVVDWAPQRETLEESAVVISHGGVNTVVESLVAGVPMIVFPLGFDQPGMAARVAYHGYGLVGDLHRATPASILARLTEIERRQDIHDRVRQVAARLREVDPFPPVLDFLERLETECLTFPLSYSWHNINRRLV